MVPCSAGVFFWRANVFAMELLFLLSPIFLCHKIKDGGYNNININKQLSPAKNTPAMQAINMVVLWTKSYHVAIQMKPPLQNLHMVLYIFQHFTKRNLDYYSYVDFG